MTSYDESRLPKENWRQTCKITLASASPRRRELLAAMGLTFDVKPSDADEDIAESSPKKLVMALSLVKARAAKVFEGCVVGADTVVVLKGRILGKPHSEENAVAMLKALRGRRHSVYTGVTVIYGGREETFFVRSRVKIAMLSDERIEEYVRDEKPLDKAGAYGIQDGVTVERYRGSYSNIVGLPLERLAKIFKKAGIAYGDD